MQKPGAVVVVVDRLGAGFLGPYGNTWVETPEFNRLAAESFLCEQALGDSPRLDVAYRSLWQGLHAMCPPNVSGAALPALACEAGLAATLLTDESQLTEHPLAANFAEQVVLAAPQATRAASEPEETGLVQLFAAACEWLSAARGPFLLWVHARGLAGPWDAPREFRLRLSDEEDPDPPEFVLPPRQSLSQTADPDERWGLVRAYAAQVALLDAALGMLLDTLAAAPHAADTLLAVTSPRGFPLGEHGRVGEFEEGLYGELLHVPLLLRFPDGRAACERTQALVQPPDLFATLAEWLHLPISGAHRWGRSLGPIAAGSSSGARDRACAVLGEERAIRTPAWFLRKATEHCELYAKPDDYWEVNEVSMRCRDVVVELECVLRQFEQTAQSAPFEELPPLPAVLAEGWD